MEQGKIQIWIVMIISRRDFFRKAAKILPILMLSVTSISPAFSGPIADCNNSCKGSCKNSCNNTCINTHKGGCSTCSSQCKGSCYGSCQSSAKGKDTIRFKW